MFKRLIASYLFWRFVRWAERLRIPTTAKTAKIVKLVEVPNLPYSMNGISAGDYFHALRNRRAQRPSDACDLSDAAFAAWRAKNNR